MNQEQFQSIGAEAGIKPEATPAPGAAEASAAAAPGAEGGAAAPEVHPYIEAMTTNLKLSGVEYTPPEGFNDLTPDKQFEVLKGEIISHSNSTEDDFITAYREAKTKGIRADDFVKGYQSANAIYDLPSNDFMVKYLQVQNGVSEENPNGWSKDDIDTYVGGLSKIELDLEAKRLKVEMRDANKAKPISPEEQVKIDNRLKVANEAIQETSTKLFAKMSKVTDIGGIPHTVEDQQNFQQVFSDLVEINPETGRARVQDFFNSDDVLYKALYLLNKAEGDGSSMKSFLSNFKESYKKDVLEKTRIHPRQDQGNIATSKIPKSEDYA